MFNGVAGGAHFSSKVFLSMVFCRSRAALASAICARPFSTLVNMPFAWVTNSWTSARMSSSSSFCKARLLLTFIAAS